MYTAKYNLKKKDKVISGIFQEYTVDIDSTVLFPHIDITKSIFQCRLYR